MLNLKPNPLQYLEDLTLKHGFVKRSTTQSTRELVGTRNIHLLVLVSTTI